MKTKGGRDMNPTDAYRKQARKREIKRNRAERHYIREAFSKKTQAQTLKEELEELIAIEQNGGELNKLQKLRKKVVMEAYETAIRRQKEEDLRKRQAEEEGKQLHAGLSSVPLPKPPPLPAGPKPGLPPPPAAAPPLPPGSGPAAAQGTGAVLPPPPGPPPGAAAAAVADGSSVPAVLPPPPGPPPSPAVLPPPSGPPPPAAPVYGMLPPMLPPPAGPPPGAWLPPPAMPPPSAAGILPPPAMPPPAAAAASGILPPPAMPPPRAPSSSSSILPPPSSSLTAAGAKPAGSKTGATTIMGASTVAKRPLAHKDKALTSMVPASVLVRREAAAAAASAAGGGGGSKPGRIDPSAEVQIGPGFGLAPVQRSAVGNRVGGSRLAQQLQQPQEQGKWGSVVQTYVAPAGQPKGSAGGKPAGVDSKLADFMDSLKDLGAFE